MLNSFLFVYLQPIELIWEIKGGFLLNLGKMFMELKGNQPAFLSRQLPHCVLCLGRTSSEELKGSPASSYRESEGFSVSTIETAKILKAINIFHFTNSSVLCFLFCLAILCARVSRPA